MAKVVLSTILLIIISASSTPLTSRGSDRCPDSWAVFGNSCYKLIASKLRWFDAQVMCKTVDSSLVKIESEKENEFVHRLARGVAVWIGLSDVVDVGSFVWVNSQRAPTYKKWKNSHPNTINETHHCAFMWPLYGGVWNASDCEEKKAAICEDSWKD